MKPLRIVLLTVEPPLPFGNAVGRWYYVLLKGLVERGHRVSAFSTCNTQAEADQAMALFPAPDYSLRCYPPAGLGTLRSKVNTLWRPHSNLFSAALRQDFERELARGFDLLHLESHWSGWLGMAHRDAALLNLHYLFQIDLAGQRPDSSLDRARQMRSFQAETFLIRKYPLVCTVTGRLSQRVRELNPSAEVHTLPFGMDLSQYPFAPARNPGNRVVTLIGSYNWMPTFTAGQRLLERLWPVVQARVPDAQLRLVGRRAMAAFGKYADEPGISIFEDVPDTAPYFRDADVLLYAPGQGSGVKVKVLEAFSLGLPVVTTSEGVEGTDARDGVHAGVSDDDAGLIDRTVALLLNPAAGQRQSHAGRLLMETSFTPEVALAAVERVYRTVAEHRRTRKAG